MPEKLLAFGFRNGPTSCPVESFQSVVSKHHFLFRVHHEKSHVHYTQDSGFTAHRYRSGWTAVRANMEYATIARDHAILAQAVYGHLCNDTGSPFISTTFNLPWTLLRADLLGSRGEADVEIVIIDGTKISSRSFFALEKLYDSNRQYSIRVCREANAAQEVLVPVQIPSAAVISRAPWKILAEHMCMLPRWFLVSPSQIEGRNVEISSRRFMARARVRFTDQKVSRYEAIVDAVTFTCVLLQSWLRLQDIFPWKPSKETRTRISPMISALAFEIVRWPGLLSHSERCSAEEWDWAIMKSYLDDLVGILLCQVKCPSIIIPIKALSHVISDLTDTVKLNVDDIAYRPMNSQP
ncbi:hypothetical protein BD410DRAFT_790048 [Rickenella mellea]|uniref:DUF7587 domain-containing protein n=1 Tax=Rickenella mellea TaxID=50990 RepID=A0A4Y7Q1V6_9AGAM|nr:hypothetical protein BD410DRAFT_790048 [Rickenella mellea]